jgi:nitrogen fixation protein FixH
MRTLITLVCIVGLAATIGPILVGLDSFEGIVVEKPYEAGLAWDRTMQNKAKLGWTVTLQNPQFKTGRNELSLLVIDKNNAPLTDAVVHVTVSRPSTRQYDRTYSLAQLSDKNSYRAFIDLPLKGGWDLVSEIDHRGDHASFRNTAYAEQEAP